LIYTEGKFKGIGPLSNQYTRFLWKHIFAPDFRKGKESYIARLAGWHHDYKNIIEKSGLIKVVNKKMFKNGFYKADVMWLGKSLPKSKSFFPADWTTNKVMNIIIEAYQDALKYGNVEQISSGYKIIGKTKCGITLKMYASKNGIISTVFPLLEN